MALRRGLDDDPRPHLRNRHRRDHCGHGLPGDGRGQGRLTARFTRALVRPPARTFAGGRTAAGLGVPDVELALHQHAAYCDALVYHGCALLRLLPDPAFPDSTFVEDTALLLADAAILTRPGAESRAAEVTAIAEALAPIFPGMARITGPGTLDAGDVCEAEDRVLIGISHRTNAEGARQLTVWLAARGRPARTVDIRNISGILHLKSGLTALGHNRLLVIDALAEHPAFAGLEVVRVPSGEEYAANGVRLNDVVLVAAGFPRTHALLRGLDYSLEVLEMSEFAKMDGGLSCLSLRW